MAILTALAVALVGLAMPAWAAAQALDEFQVKAVSLFNFTQFME